jgi:hypothetical protein
MKLIAEFNEIKIYTNSKEGSASGNIAVAEITFGDETPSSIMLVLSRGENGVSWRPPMLTLQQNGHAAPMPAYTGPLVNDAKFLAIKAVEKIKEIFGKTEYGASYQIAKGVCERVDNPK